MQSLGRGERGKERERRRGREGKEEGKTAKFEFGRGATRRAMAARELGPFGCALCDVPAHHRSRRRNHETSQRHLLRVEEAARSAAAGDDAARARAQVHSSSHAASGHDGDETAAGGFDGEEQPAGEAALMEGDELERLIAQLAPDWHAASDEDDSDDETGDDEGFGDHAGVNDASALGGSGAGARDVHTAGAGSPPELMPVSANYRRRRCAGLRAVPITKFLPALRVRDRERAGEAQLHCRR